MTKPHIYIFKKLEDNSCVYVGKHNGSNKYYFTGSCVLNKVYKERGSKWFKNNYKKEVIAFGDFSEDDLNFLEKVYIKSYNTFKGKGYNMTEGGDGAAHPHTDETKKKIGEFHSIKVAKLDRDTKEVLEVFPSAREAARKMGVNQSTITKAISRDTKNCCGFSWKKLIY